MLTWAYFTPCSSVIIVNFEHVIANWGWTVRWRRMRDGNAELNSKELSSEPGGQQT